MKKTFRLAAVLVALAALVMASCQNAAGGSGGGGGGVTPSPTPPSPEPAELVKGDAVKLVGSYTLSTSPLTRLVLNADGTGAISYGTASASVRSIQLNDVEFTWKLVDDPTDEDALILENMSVDGAVKTDVSDVKPEDVLIPYVKLTLPEGSKVDVDGGELYYSQFTFDANSTTTGTVKTSDAIKIPGLQLSLLDGVGAPVALGTLTAPYVWGSTGTGVTQLKLNNSSGDLDKAVTSDRGIDVTLDVDGVTVSTGGVVEPDAPKAAELAGTWTVALGESSITYVDGSDTKEVEGESAAEVFKNIPKITKDDATKIYMVTGVNMTNGGITADVDIIIYDYANIDKNFKENKGDPSDPSTKDKGGLYYTVDSEDSDTLIVSGMKKLAETDDDTDQNRGFATAVIADCTVTVNSTTGAVVLSKVFDDTDPISNVTTVLTLTPNVPFADAPNMAMTYTKDTGADVEVNKLMFQKGVVTE